MPRGIRCCTLRWTMALCEEPCKRGPGKRGDCRTKTRGPTRHFPYLYHEKEPPTLHSKTIPWKPWKGRVSKKQAQKELLSVPGLAGLVLWVGMG